MWWGVIKESLQKHLEIKGRQRQKLFEGKEGVQGCHPLSPFPLKNFDHHALNFILGLQ